MSFTDGRTGQLRFIVTSALLVAAATVALPVIAQAQPPAGQSMGGGPGGGGGGGGRMMASLFDGITLSDAQRKSVDSIRTAYQPQMQQLRSQGPDGRGQMRDLMHKETGDFRSILTPDQQTTFDKNLAAMQARMQQGGGRPGGGNPQ